jgi:hypothetical protein
MHRSILVALTVVLGALMVGCDNCPAPATTTYSCEPLPAGSRGCAMDPGVAFGRPVGPPPGGGVAAVGCLVTLPYCPSPYPDSPAQCRCMELSAADGGVPEEPQWVCPL